MIFDRSYKRLLYQVVAGTIVFLAIVLVGLLAAASANTEFFDRYFTLLYKVNLVIGVLLVVIIGGLMLALALRARRGKFGTRLMTKLAVFFGVVGVLPGVLIYLVSLQFVSRSIESWFDVKVESALEAGLNLGRSTMDTALADLQNKGRLIAEQVGDGSASATAITLNRLREQFGVQEATIFTASGRVIATASNTYDTLVPNLPDQAVLEQARAPGGYASLEGGSDTETDSASAPAASAPAARSNGRRNDLYQLHVVVALGTSSRDEPSIGLNTPARKWAGTGLLADRRPEDGSSTSRGFGLIGESGRDERFLQRIEPAVLLEPFHRRHGFAVGPRGQVAARVDRVVVDDHRARPALAAFAPELRAGQVQMIAQQFGQRPMVVDLQALSRAVDRDPHGGLRSARRIGRLTGLGVERARGRGNHEGGAGRGEEFAA